MGDNQAILASLAVEFWKLLRSHERTLDHVPHEHLAKTQAQLRFSAGKLESLLKDAGLVLVVFRGPFAANLPATAVNGDDFDGVDGTLFVERTVEPAVIEQDGIKVLRMGKVWLTKGNGDVSRD